MLVDQVRQTTMYQLAAMHSRNCYEPAAVSEGHRVVT